MAKNISEISFFFPCFNEEKNVKYSVEQAKKILSRLATKWQIIIVDDGSSDKTGKIANELSKSDRHIEVVHNRPNRGYGGALKAGFEASKYNWVGFADVDRQFDIGELELFIEKQRQTGADLVLGIRANRADSFIRKLFTLVWSKILPRVLLGLKVTDYSCGFKLLRRDVYKKVQPLVGEEKVTQIELLTKAQRKGFKFAEVKVNHYPRKFGHQTGADIKVITRSMRDLLKLWWQLR